MLWCIVYTLRELLCFKGWYELISDHSNRSVSRISKHYDVPQFDFEQHKDVAFVLPPPSRVRL